MTLPETYRKVIVKQSNRDPKQALEIVSVPLTLPAPNELLVQNLYAGVNYTDIARMMGISRSGANPPFDFGLEAAGKVVAIGSDVTDYAIGDFVIAGLPGYGYREYGRIAANMAVKLPAIKDAYVGLFISGAAAKIALEYAAEITNNEIVVVTAPLHSSGHYAVQLAKRAGCTVIGLSESAEDAPIMRQLGVDWVINRLEEDISESLRKSYPSRLNLVYDSMGGKVLDACLEHTAPRARVILTEALREHITGDDSMHLIHIYNSLIQKSVVVRGFNLSDYASMIRIEGLKMLDLYERGEIRTIIDPHRFHGIESVVDAIQLAIDGKGRGKIIVNLAE